MFLRLWRSFTILEDLRCPYYEYDITVFEMVGMFRAATNSALTRPKHSRRQGCDSSSVSTPLCEDTIVIDRVGFMIYDLTQNTSAQRNFHMINSILLSDVIICQI